MSPRPLRLAKLGALGIVASMIVASYYAGVFADLTGPGELADRLVAMGTWGYLAFLLAYTVLQPFGVPGTVFIVAAALIWPWHTAFGLSMVGTMSASVVGFSFARFVARDWMAARIPARLRKYDKALEENAFRTVVFLRLIFWMAQVVHCFLGVSKVRFWTHFWGSLLGYIPPLLIVSYLGGELFDAGGHVHPRAWPIFGGLFLGSLALIGILRFCDKRRRLVADGPPEPEPYIVPDFPDKS